MTEAHQGLRIEAIGRSADRPTLSVTVSTTETSWPAEVPIDGNTAEHLRGVCSEQPFERRPGQHCTYWIVSLGYTEDRARFRADLWHRWDPRLHLLIRRGRSRVKRTVPCTVEDFESLHPMIRETLSHRIRETIEPGDRARRFLWREPGGSKPD
jgi:hypothetical protein